ncbi:hypothetical protein D9619_002522 [Psilocybe cf. subviscida]|uniref:LysM domain-containing protein n=1 Tax=Psilocybe cf. subviscida TaxID=2480587 RepID=A0A8H5ETI6_9AGAR|nr:hypothetical protein D9619_002522 [Psilocybe cf. subviscida]
MGRWTQLDEDEHRLPEGMKRIGYDADEGRYYFRDGAGNVWRGGQRAEFGEMTRVNSLPPVIHEEEDDEEEDGEAGTTSSRGRLDVEASPRAGYELLPTHHTRPNSQQAYRTLFPFFLIIAVVLLLIWRLILSPGLSTPVKRCPEGTASYWIQPGESCWDLSHKNGWTLDKFKENNPKVVCDPLMPGTSVCLPIPKAKAKALANVQAQARTSMRKSSSSSSKPRRQ